MEDVDDAHRTRAGHVAQAGSGGVDLPNAGFVAELQGGLVDLGETGGPAGVAASGEASVGRERDPAAETGCAIGDESVALAVSADAEQLVVHELLDRKGIVDLDEIESASAENRERLDQLLVGTLGVRLVPARNVKPVKPECRVLTADATASETTEVDSRLLWIRSEQPAFIQLGKFGPGASATAWFTGAGKPTGYLIPPDLSDQPWRIGFAGAGKVTVCPARPAK